jgi:hypothetical protein
MMAFLQRLTSYELPISEAAEPKSALRVALVVGILLLMVIKVDAWWSLITIAEGASPRSSLSGAKEG